MKEFRQIDDANPALAHLPMVRALEKTFTYIAEHGGIGLTPSKAVQANKRPLSETEFEGYDCYATPRPR